jgi:hypothetical protein
LEPGDVPHLAGAQVKVQAVLGWLAIIHPLPEQLQTLSIRGISP